MQALDTTIANVALPYIQGSVSASADQINWVLTSYIVAAAIMTPPSGFLANRFGRKRVLLDRDRRLRRRLDPVRLGAVADRRSSASACCRACSARRWCRCRRASCSTSTPSRSAARPWRCSASRSWSARCSARCIGGWLTDNISWRWVFYINLPIGALAFAGVSMFVMETKTNAQGASSTGSASARSASPSPRCRCFSIAASSSTGSPRARSSSRR